MKPEIAVPLTLVSTMLVLWFFVEKFLSSFILSYRLEDEAIVFVLFCCIPIRKIKYVDIAEIKMGGILENFIIAVQSETHTSKLLGPRIFIKRKKGLIPWIAITPEHPVLFFKELHNKINKNSIL